ncbi:MAG: autotransporter assembly complex family protein [Pseudomonadota bacterium]
MRLRYSIAVAAILLVSSSPVWAFDIFRLGGSSKDEDVQTVLDPQTYQVEFDVSSADENIPDQIRRASTLWSSRSEPASGAAGLISTAQGDYRSILARLYNLGYYAPAISIRIDGTEATDLGLTTDLPEPASVVVRVDSGPRFRFGTLDIANPPRFNRDEREDEGSPLDLFKTGRVARADIITGVEAVSVNAWRRAGHPKAALDGREVTADHARSTLDVTIRLDPGRQARFGTVNVQPAQDVDADFIAYIADIPEGRVFDPRIVEASVERLNALRVFRAARIEEAEQISPDGTLPLTIETLPRKPRRFGVGATLSSLEGLGLEGFWLHRNLSRRAERLRFDAGISGIGATDNPENYDYSLGVTFTRPGSFRPDTDLIARAEVSQEVFDTYTERAAEIGVGLTRQFLPELDGSVGLEVSYSEIEDDRGTRDFLTFALPVSVTYDRRNDDLDPTRGYYLQGTVTPFQELEFDTTAVRAVAEGRVYFEVDDDRTVLAFRGLLGSVLGGTLSDISPGELFFTGGGGSIRGFDFRSNGLEIDGDTVGGRSKLELGAEVRQRITSRIGVVGFVDSGVVSSDTFPSMDGDLRLGAGAGLRYYSGLGPLRLDIATPIDRRSDEPVVALYIGIGQAF